MRYHSKSPIEARIDLLTQKVESALQDIPKIKEMNKQKSFH